MSSYSLLSKYIVENSESITNEVVTYVLENMNLKISEQEEKQAVDMYIDLLGFFAESLLQKEQDVVPTSLVDWSKKNAGMQLSAGGNISAIIVRYQPTRVIFSDILTRIGLEFDLSVQENAFLVKKINSMLDISLNETVLAFENLSEKHKREAQKEVLALSSPLVPVKEGIVVLPLIGSIDEARVNHMMNETVPKIAEMRTYYVIADFSGLLEINSQVAFALHQIGNTLRLMGIQVIATGLRPDLVQVTINSGIDLSVIQTFATVKQALESID